MSDTFKKNIKTKAEMKEQCMEGIAKVSKALAVARVNLQIANADVNACTGRLEKLMEILAQFTREEQAEAAEK